MIFYITLITTVLILGATVVTQEGMLFYFLRVSADKKKKKIFDALILCVWCMPSVWSLIGIAISFGVGVLDSFSYRVFFVYPIVVCASSVLSGIVWSLYSYISVRMNHVTNLEIMSHWDIKERKKSFSQNFKHNDKN